MEEKAERQLGFFFFLIAVGSDGGAAVLLPLLLRRSHRDQTFPTPPSLSAGLEFLAVFPHQKSRNVMKQNGTKTTV